jgi:uncharacterized protein (TIGR00369 family)
VTTPDRPWWQLYLDGLAAEGVAPGFVPVLGITPDGWEPEGTVRLRWEPPAFTRTPGGWVQGGFLGVVLDMAQTFALFTRLDEGRAPMTLEMKISYIEASFADRYMVEGRAVRHGRHVGHTDGRITDEEGKLIATSTSTHVIRTFSR